MRTLLLDTVAWDLVLDVKRDIAVANEPYALAQDAASAIKLFQSELWYDTTKGVPYWASILGASPPPLSLMKAKFVEAAKTVPGVLRARCFLASASARRVTGQVQVTDRANRIAAANF